MIANSQKIHKSNKPSASVVLSKALRLQNYLKTENQNLLTDLSQEERNYELLKKTHGELHNLKTKLQSQILSQSIRSRFNSIRNVSNPRTTTRTSFKSSSITKKSDLEFKMNRNRESNAQKPKLRKILKNNKKFDLKKIQKNFIQNEKFSHTERTNKTLDEKLLVKDVFGNKRKNVLKKVSFTKEKNNKRNKRASINKKNLTNKIYHKRNNESPNKNDTLNSKFSENNLSSQENKENLNYQIKRKLDSKTTFGPRKKSLKSPTYLFI